MHDPVPQTGQWLKSVVRRYFNYYAVPDNLASLGVFRDRVLALLVANDWSLEPETPDLMDALPGFGSAMVFSTASAPSFPDARFAASHPR